MIFLWFGLFLTLVLAILAAMFIRAIFVPMIIAGLVIWGLYATGMVNPEPRSPPCFVQSGCQ